MPVRLAVTEGTVADCTQALPLIEGIEAQCLLADKAYDTNEIIGAATELGMDPVIPPKSNRKEKRDTEAAIIDFLQTTARERAAIATLTLIRTR